jgi:hypothetical protein
MQKKRWERENELNSSVCSSVTKFKITKEKAHEFPSEFVCLFLLLYQNGKSGFIKGHYIFFRKTKFQIK